MKTILVSQNPQHHILYCTDAAFEQLSQYSWQTIEIDGQQFAETCINGQVVQLPLSPEVVCAGI